MEMIEFNLLRESWIRVMTDDCGIEEISLVEALTRAHEFRALAGELPTQDYAILRLLLAVLHTIFGRVDEEGNEFPLDTEEEALRRWKALWEKGRFPEAAISGYLSRYEDRFWLFHPEKPFYQVPAAVKGTSYTAEKLIGELSRSNNKEKLRLIVNRQADCLDYAEAARWLVSLNGFDDSSTKVETGTGAAWLGQLGNIYADGETLFQTLMLNLTLLRDGQELWEAENCPVWEKPPIAAIDKREIIPPENPAELLTLQSRRILLQRENGVVTGYMDAGGDYFADASIVSEQMTLWQEQTDKKKKTAAPRYIPARHLPERQLWRDFEKIFPADERAKRPGIALWIQKLEKKRMIPRKLVHFRTVGARYDKKGASLVEVISDHVDFHIELLSELDASWVRMTEKQINLAERAAYWVGNLAENLVKAAGGTGKNAAETAKLAYYARLDLPFREWLLALDPQGGSEARERAERAWRRIGYDLTVRLGRELADQAGEAAFVGREVVEKKDGREEKRYYCTPKDFSNFACQIGRVFEIARVKEATQDGTR